MFVAQADCKLGSLLPQPSKYWEFQAFAYCSLLSLFYSISPKTLFQLAMESERNVELANLRIIFLKSFILCDSE